ncbi:MAG: NUDIX domain-containing protein [Bacteroidota bacterium]
MGNKVDLDAFADRLSESLPGISVDCVVFGYDSQQLHVLLLKWKYEEAWSLPGGFVHSSESLDDAAHRVLDERTGLRSIFLQQFHTFGALGRAASGHESDYDKMRKILERMPLKGQKWDINWFAKRFVSTAYFALVDMRRARPHPDFLSERCEWVSLEEVPDLILDHRMMLDMALQYLRRQLQYLPIGRSLLPERFTMPELQGLYEAILGHPLVRSNFQRKMLNLGTLIRHEKLMTGAANKAPYLYSFDPVIYERLLEEGIGF